MLSASLFNPMGTIDFILQFAQEIVGIHASTTRQDHTRLHKQGRDGC